MNPDGILRVRRDGERFTEPGPLVGAARYTSVRRQFVDLSSAWKDVCVPSSPCMAQHVFPLGGRLPEHGMPRRGAGSGDDGHGQSVAGSTVDECGPVHVDGQGQDSSIAFATVASLAPWARVATETCGTHRPGW